MFKEILHYTFKQPGAALDISGFHHHGQVVAVDHNADGAASGSGAYVFDGQASRVHVPFGKAWKNLGAVQIEALVRIEMEHFLHTNVLVEGHLSFALVVGANHIVHGYVAVPVETEGPAPDETDPAPSHDIFSTLTALPPDPDEPDVEIKWFEVSSLAVHSPDGIVRKLETGVWTRVTLIHNGFSLQLWLDDELVGYRDDVSFGVPGVQPGGVYIGSRPTGLPRLRGALDEVRIWKFDPSFVKKRFFCRPTDAPTEICWQALHEHLIRQRRDPEAGPTVAKALGCISDALDDLSRAIYSQGADVINRLEAFRRRYDRLWCEGKIDGPEMAGLFAEFGEWLDRVAGEAFGASVAKLLGCREALYRCGEDHDLTCITEHDAAWLAYAKLIGEHGLRGYCAPPFPAAPTEPPEPYSSKHRY